MRWVVGLLLVGAAVLKAAQLLAEPALSAASPALRYLVPLQIAAEAGLGLLALSGVWWRQLRWLALVFFSAFALYSFHLATSGAATCGCFGALNVHPWWTFAIDAAVVAGLAASIAWGTNAVPIVARPRQAIALAMLCGVALGGTVFAAALRAAGSSSLAAGDGLVVLEPEAWIGQRLPIAEFIDADLSQGEWTVLLHRHDCPDCQEATPQYESLAAGRNVALVEVPPFGQEVANSGPAVYTRLREERDWFVQTPVEMRLSSGVVVGASTDLPAIRRVVEL